MQTEKIEPQRAVASAAPRAVSIDVLRALVMFTMIYVNDIAGASESVVPGMDAAFSWQWKRNDFCGSGISRIPFHCRHVDSICTWVAD